MKKIVCLFCFLSVLLFSSCAQEELIDIFVFTERFNSTDNFQKIDEDELSLEEINGELHFDFMAECDILLTVVSDKNTNKIKRCFATYEYKNNMTALDEKEKENFLLMCKTMIMCYTKASQKETDEIIKRIGMNSNNFFSNPENLSQTIDFNSYHFFCNKFGLSFTVESTRLNAPDPTDSKIR